MLYASLTTLSCLPLPFAKLPLNICLRGLGGLQNQSALRPGGRKRTHGKLSLGSVCLYVVIFVASIAIQTKNDEMINEA